MNELLMMVGIPRSGKTEVAKRLSHKEGAPIVSPDAIRLALHGQAYVQSAEGLVWATAHLMVSSLFAAGHDRVIFDACSVTKKRRDEWEPERNGMCWTSRKFFVVPTSLDVCEVRLDGEIEDLDFTGSVSAAADEARQSLEKIREAMRRMSGAFESPSPDEGEVFNLVYDSLSVSKAAENGANSLCWK